MPSPPRPACPSFAQDASSRVGARERLCWRFTLASRKSNDATPPPEPRPALRGAQAWLTQRLAGLRARRAAPAVRAPSRPRLRAPRHRWWSSFGAARLAVRAGIPLDDFLQHRLSQHLARLPVPPARLPLTVAIDPDGAVITAPAAAPAHHAPWLESFLRAEGNAAVSREVQLHQADAARLAARIESQRRRVEEAGRDVDEATRGAALADPGDEAQARQMGRPPVPPPLGAGLQLFALALLAGETWQLAVPVLGAAGVRTRHLASELQRDPAGVVLGLLFALGASASLFLFGHLALRRGVESAGGPPDTGRRAWTAVFTVAATAAALAMAWSIAALRPGVGGAVDLRYARLALFLVALAVPLTAAWLLGLGRRLDAARAEAQALARAWDREHYQTLAEVSRRAAVLADEEQRLARLEEQRSAAVRRARALQQRAAAAERLAEDAAGEEEEELAALAQAVTAALELDRYEYVRQACRRGLPVEPGRLQAAAAPPVRAAPAEVSGHNLGLAG